MTQAVTTEFLGIPQVIRSASCWLLVFLCAALVMGCSEEKQQSVRVKTAPTTALTENNAMEKAAREFYEKSNLASTTKGEINPHGGSEINPHGGSEKNPPSGSEKKVTQPVFPRQIFISTAPWTLLAPPHDYPGDFLENIPGIKIKTKPTIAKSAKKLVKKTAKAKSEDRIAAKPTKKKAALTIPKEQIIVHQPMKKFFSPPPGGFISTAPWTLLAPPSDYDESKSSDAVGTWQPNKKKTAHQVTKKSKPARPIVKKQIRKPVVIAKISPEDWIWDSSPKLECRSRRGIMFPATTPWALVAPPSVHTARLDMTATTAELPRLPGPNRRMLCELRVVRVSDGRVISSASAIATCGNIDRLARALVGEFGRDGEIPIGVSIIAASLSNREGTDEGLLLAEKMTEHVISALKRASKFKFLKYINLRDIFVEEQKLELSRAITTKPARKLMQDAKYIVLGGISLQHPVPVSLPTQDEDSLASKSAYYDD